jgi:hypothetical protein
MADKTSEPGDHIAPVREPTSQPPPSGKPTREKAAEFLATHGGEQVTFTWEEEKKVIKRIDRRVLVLILWAYFFQQLDKSSLR